MTEKTIEAFSQFGLLGLVLLAIGVGAFGVWRWVSAHMLKPLIDSHIRQSEKMVDAQVTLNERMAVFMNVMARHASAEEEQLLRMATVQQKLGDTQERLVFQKDSIELLASEVRSMKTAAAEKVR